jgi:ABC-type sugar transport system ATPase subunit
MIKLNGITKVFDGRGIAGLHGIDLEFNQGEILAVMGPNGSGKTTLINVITKSIKPDKGSLEVSGEVRLFIEPTNLPDINVQKYLIRQVNHEIEDEKKLQLARDLADIFEFTFQLRQNLSQLSAGQRQKVLLAAEVINKPSLLLLDEPFTHLDPHTRKDILHSLFTYIRRQEISILWVTHDLEEALSFSDKVGILNFGKFEQLDSPLTLINLPKNLFVAKFLGYENFLPIKKVNEKWSTPWGDFKDSDYSEPQALLVIPEESLHLSDQGLLVKVDQISLKGLSQRLQVLLEDKTLQVKLRPRSRLPQIGETLRVQAQLEECFLIPL